MNTTIVAAVIFGATYVLISLRRIRFLNLDRPSAAATGAILMVAVGVLTFDEAYAAVSKETLALLFGMMVVIAYLKEAGFFEAVSGWILRRSRTPRRMLVTLVFASGVLSALFVNDTICLLFTPILLSAVARAGLEPTPYLIALVTSSNIGSVMTLTGNPQNMLIGIASGISFGWFFVVLLPVALVCLLLDAALLLWIYRARLPAAFAGEPSPAARLDGVVVRRILVLLALMLAGFLLPVERWVEGLRPGQKLPLVALVGAAAAMLIGRSPPKKALAHVDWGLLLFFTGLFVVVGGVGKVNVLRDMHDAVTPFLGGSPGEQMAAFGAFTVVGSNVVSNVPFVLVACDWVKSFAHPALMWYVLAVASTFAGNLTIVGSVANIIVMEQAKERVTIGFLAYLRAGLPITLATTVVGLALLWAGAALGVPL